MRLVGDLIIESALRFESESVSKNRRSKGLEEDEKDCRAVKGCRREAVIQGEAAPRLSSQDAPQASESERVAGKK